MKDLIRRLPKFDLHVHLDGSMRAETVLEFIGLSKHDPERYSPQDIDQRLHPPARCTLDEYLQAFEVTIAALQGEAQLERAAYELCEDASSEKVVYMEIRFAPLLHTTQGLSPEAVVEAVLSGLDRAKSALPIQANLILCAMKQESPSRSLQVAELAARYRRDGVVALDLAGPEQDYPPSIHLAAVDKAKAEGLNVTIHAGESCCPGHIRQAIEIGADRIGHGVYLFQDEETEELVADRGIPLEVCPTSNMQISRLISSYADHPFKRYLERGLRVTLNTDNRLMSEIDVTHELTSMTEAFALTEEELKQVLLNSADAAFIPEKARARYSDRVRQSFSEI